MLSWHFPGELQITTNPEPRIAYLSNEGLTWDALSAKWKFERPYCDIYVLLILSLKKQIFVWNSEHEEWNQF
jgi:hypothetical protein